MNIDIFKLVLWTISLVIGEWYLYFYIKPKYGITSSISSSAKKVKQDGKPWLFAIFILSMTIPLAFIGEDIDSILAASLLSMIAFFTGYNDHVENDELEDTLHVIFTMAAIGIGLEWILRQSLWNIPAVVSFLIFAIIFTKKRIKNRTWWIEEYFRYMFFIYMFIYRVIQ